MVHSERKSHDFGDIKSTINRLFVSQLEFINICKTSKSFIGISVFKSCGVLPLRYISWSILVEPSILYKVISCVYHFDSFRVAVTPSVSL